MIFFKKKSAYHFENAVTDLLTLKVGRNANMSKKVFASSREISCVEYDAFVWVERECLIFVLFCFHSLLIGHFQPPEVVHAIFQCILGRLLPETVPVEIRVISVLRAVHMPNFRKIFRKCWKRNSYDDNLANDRIFHHRFLHFTCKSRNLLAKLKDTR